MPKGLVIELEPSIGNQDDEFKSKWYQRLQEFSFTLMNGIIEFSEKTVEETTTNIETALDSLKNSMQPNDFKEANEQLEENSTTRKRILKQNKQKKFYNLKYHREAPSRQANYGTEDPGNAPAETERRVKQYQRDFQQTRQQVPPKPLNKPWNSLFGNKNAEAKSDNSRIDARRDNSRTNARRNNSRTNARRDYSRPDARNSNGSDNHYDQEIRNLREEIATLKGNKEHAKQKNSFGVPSRSRRGDDEEATHSRDTRIMEAPELSDVMNFLNTTMKALIKFKDFFEQQQPTEETPSDM